VSLGHGVVCVVVETHVSRERNVINSSSRNIYLVVVDRFLGVNLLQALFGVVILVFVGMET